MVIPLHQVVILYIIYAINLIFIFIYYYLAIFSFYLFIYGFYHYLYIVHILLLNIQQILGGYFSILIYLLSLNYLMI